MNTTLVHLSTILLLLLQSIPTIHAASCSTSIAYTCNTRGISATQRLTLTVTDHDDTNYDATGKSALVLFLSYEFVCI